MIRTLSAYTVLILRPDYIADEFGKDTFLAHVTADCLLDAVREARKQVIKVDDNDALIDEMDYAVLFTCYGHQDDLNY